MQPKADTHWRANFPEFFLWAEWDEEDASVLFHEGSGETLLLNPLGGFLLKLLCNEQLSLEALTERIADYFQLSLDEELRESIRRSLYTFEQKGLILSTPA